MLWWGGGTANNETHWQPLLLPQTFDKLLKFRNQSGNLFSLCTDLAFSKEIVDTCTQASNFELTSGLKITDSRSPVMMTCQILFSPDKQCYRAKRIKRQLYGKYYEMLKFASKNDRSKWQARREFDRWRSDIVHWPAVILSPVLKYKSWQVCRKIGTILTVLALGAVLS